ncbi:Uncharacterised protein [Burkholderia pseudomallei]|nr:Uncharacterised protein [Burkholderia pseudomallei]
MSGGALDYAYFHVESVADQIEQDYASTPLDHEFVEHLRLVAAALRALEWALSGDSSPENAVEAIERCLGHDTKRSTEG